MLIPVCFFSGCWVASGRPRIVIMCHVVSRLPIEMNKKLRCGNRCSYNVPSSYLVRLRSFSLCLIIGIAIVKLSNCLYYGDMSSWLPSCPQYFWNISVSKIVRDFSAMGVQYMRFSHEVVGVKDVFFKYYTSEHQNVSVTVQLLSCIFCQSFQQDYSHDSLLVGCRSHTWG